MASWLLHADDKASKMRHEKCMKTCNENAPNEELQAKNFQKVIFHQIILISISAKF